MNKKKLIPTVIENVPIGMEFILNPKGACWIKESTQGMYNQVHYCRSAELIRTRCRSYSYRHRYVYSGTKVFVL